MIWDVQLSQFHGSLGGWTWHIGQLRAADPQSAGRSTRSGWHSADRAILDMAVFTPLAAEITRLVAGALAHMAGEEVPFKLTSWVNLHDRGGLNQLHMHAHALLRGEFLCLDTGMSTKKRTALRSSGRAGMKQM